MKHKRPFNDGKFIQSCCVGILNFFASRGEDMASVAASIPLSRDTTTRRVEDLDLYLINKLKFNLNGCTYFSLAFDETTDISDTSQL